VRPLAAHEWRAYRDLRLRALADAPDAFGSTLEREHARDDAHWQARLEAGVTSGRDLPLVAEAGGEPAGLAWGTMDPAGTAHLIQMWVAPERRGHGCGGRLLDAVAAWARERGAHTLALMVTQGNASAEGLYARAGFVQTGPPTPLRPGSPLLSRPLRLEL
jgi:GNAT superfamily N-acetyltransferase